MIAVVAVVAVVAAVVAVVVDVAVAAVDVVVVAVAAAAGFHWCGPIRRKDWSVCGQHLGSLSPAGVWCHRSPAINQCRGGLGSASIFLHRVPNRSTISNKQTNCCVRRVRERKKEREKEREREREREGRTATGN